jgi:hypothetical protein
MRGGEGKAEAFWWSSKGAGWSEERNKCDRKERELRLWFIKNYAGAP